MFELKQSEIEGCFELQFKAVDDERGRFVKVFQDQVFSEHGLVSNFPEEYYSVSQRNVIRGMHFQLPPMDHVKVVYCVEGEVIDAVVDLRLDSPTFGQYTLFELSSVKANAIYIPKGMAHGFCVRSEQAIMVYKVSTVYSPEHDAGILWDSAGIKWGITSPILSERDQRFPTLDVFESPFKL